MGGTKILVVIADKKIIKYLVKLFNYNVSFVEEHDRIVSYRFKYLTNGNTHNNSMICLLFTLDNIQTCI